MDDQLHDKIVECDAILKNDPRNNTWLAIKGTCLAKLNKYQEAIEAYEKVLEIDPRNIYVVVSKGICLRALGKYKESIEMCDKALKLNPTHPSALENRELARRGENIEINVSYPIDTYALVRKGDDFQRSGEYQEASEIFNKVMEEVDTNYSYALTRKTECLARLGKGEKNHELSLDRLNKAPETTSEPMLDPDTIGLLQAFLILAAIFVFIIGLVVIFGGGLKN